MKTDHPLFIIFIDLGIGGIQRRIVDLVNYLVDYRPNLQVYIFLRSHSEFDISNQIKNKNITVINYLDWAKIKIPFFFPFFIFYHVWKLKPKAILAFLDISSLIAVWSKLLFFWRRIVIVLNEAHFASKIIASYEYSQLRFFLIKTFYPLADVVISPTKATKKDLVENLGLSTDKVKVIPNWTAFSRRGSNKAKKRYDLIYVGRLAMTKNLKLVLRAIKKIRKYKKDIKLIIIGEGEERRTLEAFAERHGLEKNVEFFGPRYEVKDLLQKSRIFIYTSKYQTEGFPLAILEAMAMGVPVLTRRFAGVEEVIKDGENGFVFSSFEELVERVLWLLENSARGKEVAQGADRYVRKYHSQENMRDYFEALRI